MDDELKNDSLFDMSDRPSNQDSDALFEDSFSSIAQAGASTSTPIKTKPVMLKSTVKKAPATKRKKKEEKLKCNQCPSLFANKRTLDTHLRGHVMKGVTARGPTHSDFKESMRVLIKEAAQAVLKEKAVGELWEKVQKQCAEFCENLDSGGDFNIIFEILSEEFLKILKSSKVVFPSAVRSVLYSGTNKLLNNRDFRQVFLDNFSLLCVGREDSGNILITDIVMRLSQKVAIFTMKKMLANTSLREEVMRKKSTDDVESLNFQQLCYYIGGSVVAGYLHKGQIYSKNSETWTSYVEVLKAKFVCGEDGLNKCSDRVRAYTEVRDRGGLVHLSSEAFDFFLILFDVIMSCEGESGSLSRDVINKTVLDSDVLICLWDALVGDNLREEEKSLDLLIRIIQSATRIVSKGILTRRLNDAMTQSYAAVAHRPRLAH